MSDESFSDTVAGPGQKAAPALEPPSISRFPEPAQTIVLVLLVSAVRDTGFQSRSPVEAKLILALNFAAFSHFWP